ncbi:MAG: hypothetical protein M3O86_03800, partial [Actinomycetota bacterium]|nr:hypothetical protein [Actinomycetota bacterium]
MREDGQGQPGGVGGELARRRVRQRPVFEVADDQLDAGVGTVVGLGRGHVAVAVGDQGVMVDHDVQRQLRAGGGTHPPHDQAHVDGVAVAALERRVGHLGDVGAAVEPVRDRRPRVLGDRVDRGADGVVHAHRDRKARVRGAA